MTDRALTDRLAAIKGLLWPDESPKQRQKRLRILRVAHQQFLTRGYRKASIQEIATGSGVSKGSIYLYFNSKAELLFQVLAFESEAYIEQLLLVLERQDAPIEQLRQFLDLGLKQHNERSLAQAHRWQLLLQEITRSCIRTGHSGTDESDEQS